jgi:hypothetical protein
MAKRVPPDEKPFRPVDEQLARSVLLRRKIGVVESEPPGLELAPSTDSQPIPPGETSEELKKPKLRVAENGESEESKEDEEQAEAYAFASRRKTLTREKRMLLTPQEEELFLEFVGNISKNLGVKVNTSNLLRASLALLLHAERELFKQCRRVDYMRKKRPRNDHPTEIATFEENLARLFDSAIRNSKPLG